MTKVFISHSRQDSELTTNVINALKNIDVEAVAMEYLPRGSEEAPDWPRILSEVKSANYLMLFKTENAVRTEYTKSWIIFEVGLAAAFNKPLFVFERAGPPIEFPIPYLTDYMLFDPMKVEDILKVQVIAKRFGETPKPAAKGGGSMGDPWTIIVIAALIALAIQKYANGELPYALTCPRCNSQYRYYENSKGSFRCPVCLADGMNALMGK